MAEDKLLPPEMPYPWQGEQWDSLLRLHQNDRMPHAIMLNGPADVGKHQFALALAQLVLCLDPLGGYGCGRCKSCRLLAAESHPDLLSVEPEEAGKAIKIDQVRAARDFVTKTSQQGGWKVAVIDPAEAMNVNAANALLKSLEEPSANTLLILICHRVSGVPATIRSRCRMMPFSVPSMDQGLSWLSQVVASDSNPQWLLEQAGGKPLLALKLVEGDLLEQRANFDELLDQVASGSLSPVVAAEKCSRLNAAELLEWLISRVSGSIRNQLGDKASRPLFGYHDRLVTARREILGSSNPNLQLLWETLLLDWQSLRPSN